MISLTVSIKKLKFPIQKKFVYLKKALQIFLRYDEIKQNIFKTAYEIMVFLHILDITQLLTWAFALFMAAIGADMLGLPMKVLHSVIP